MEQIAAQVCGMRCAAKVSNWDIGLVNASKKFCAFENVRT